tara:strand:+ start:43 stop:357 length:315 start_codon:yes stop_codon:yes gene_type:complete
MKKSSFKMKNSLLNMSSKDGSPMQANYSGSPMKVVSFARRLLKAGKSLYKGLKNKPKTKYDPELDVFKHAKKPTQIIPQDLRSIRDEYTNIFLKHGKLKGDIKK